MVTCQNCGQENADDINFCRFCGARSATAGPLPQQQNYDFTPPRPYSWKTDEFQTNAEARKAPAFQTRNTAAPLFDGRNQAQPVARYQPAPAYPAYLCPRCMNRYPPRYEKRISTAGWVTFAILLVTIPPLFWIGFFIKEDAWICPVCNSRMA